MENPVYAILDLETTGLCKKRDKIVQIACLKIGKDESQTTWMRYVNPKMDSQYLQEGFKIHHIAPEFLQKKPPFEDVAESFCSFLKDVDFLVAHNCLFDWDMLSREFERLDEAKNGKNDNSKEEASKVWWKNFPSTYQWLDTLRLAMICFPKRNTYRLDAIKELLNIDPRQGITGKVYSEGDYDGDQWKPQQHDAMYDVLTTYGVLQHCMKSSFRDLIREFPMAVLDTSLFLDMQRLLNERKTGREDLIPFATRSKNYFTTSRPKGKKLGDISKPFLQRLTVSLRADTRADDRIILIYEAAFLEPLDNKQTSPSLSTTKQEVSDKETDSSSSKEGEENSYCSIQKKPKIVLE